MSDDFDEFIRRKNRITKETSKNKPLSSMNKQKDPSLKEMAKKVTDDPVMQKILETTSDVTEEALHYITDLAQKNQDSISAVIGVGFALAILINAAEEDGKDVRLVREVLGPKIMGETN